MSVDRAANLAEVFLMTAPSRSGRRANQIVKEAIEKACEQIERRFSKVDRKIVWDRLRRRKRRLDHHNKKGKIAQLAGLLRARRALSEANFEVLADHIETTAKVFHRQRSVPVHRAAFLAEALLTSKKSRMSDKIREWTIEFACEQIEREFGCAVDQEKVRELLRREPKRRR